MSRFLYFRGLNFVFLSIYDAFVNGIGKQRVKKILYDKYTPMLAIRDGHVDNHFNDKFVSLCHVGYFINGYLQKLTTEYICHTFYTFGD